MATLPDDLVSRDTVISHFSEKYQYNNTWCHNTSITIQFEIFSFKKVVPKQPGIKNYIIRCKNVISIDNSAEFLRVYSLTVKLVAICKCTLNLVSSYL